MARAEHYGFRSRDWERVSPQWAEPRPPPKHMLNPPASPDLTSLEANQGFMDWYVVRTKPWRERGVESCLTRHQIETFLPRLRKAARNGAGRVEPLFPGYVFARFKLNPQVFDRVRWTPGVRCVLGTESGPTPVDERVIRAIVSRADEWGVITAGLPFTPGDRVRVADGPLAGLVGIFERPTSRAERARVLLDLLAAHVEIDWRLLDEA